MTTVVKDEDVQLAVGNGIKTVNVSLLFSKYIGLPFWPERHFLINVGKEVHPKLGPEKKRQALAAALEKMGKTMDDYERAQVRAERPFYTINDKNPNLGDGEIIIPARHILSFLNNASQEAPRVVPSIKSKGLTFVGIGFRGVEGLTTGLTKSDAKMFSRFVKMEESNQRTFSESPYIENFTASGVLRVDEEIISPQDLLKLFQWGGKLIGIGSARPQGYGRFQVSRWDIS
jgi:hypothetical protein